MTDIDPQELLRRRCRELCHQTRLDDIVFETAVASIDDLIHDARAREHRAAFYNALDASKYRTGAAFEPSGGLEKIDHVALTGWLALGIVGVLLLARQAMNNPGQSIAETLRDLFESEVGVFIRNQGVWVRWQWRRELDRRETEAFMASPNFKKPQWRKEPTTADQKYRVAAHCEDLEIEMPVLETRWDAFEWLRKKGDHPRFKVAPRRPNLLKLAEYWG